MLSIGAFNRLTIAGQTKNDWLLEGGAHYGDIPLVKQEAPVASRMGSELEVFVYLDEEGYLLATTQTPLAQVGDVAWLKVVDVSEAGAWLDWGLAEDLFLPHAEQQSPVEIHRYCMVKVVIDKHYGLIASSYINDFLADEATEFEQGQKVSLLIGNATDLGFKVIINHRYWGLLYANEVFQEIHKGQTMDGYIKKLRVDNRLDVSLTPAGYAKVDAITERILSILVDNNGFIALSDKSSPEDIYQVFGVSKKVFKQAIGTLFKQRRLVIEPNGIKLL